MRPVGAYSLFAARYCFRRYAVGMYIMLYIQALLYKSHHHIVSNRTRFTESCWGQFPFPPKPHLFLVFVRYWICICQWLHCWQCGNHLSSSFWLYTNRRQHPYNQNISHCSPKDETAETCRDTSLADHDTSLTMILIIYTNYRQPSRGLG